MPHFAYSACDARGRETHGTLEGPDLNAVLARIREMGFFPTNVVSREKELARPSGSRAGGVNGLLSALGRRRSRSRRRRSGAVPRRSLTVFTRQLSTILAAGMPLLRGLNLIAEQERNRNLRRVIHALVHDIENGGSFSDALSVHPAVFNRLFVNMAKAGELGGALEVVLRRVAEFLEKSQKIKSRVIGALFYPAAVLFVAFAILTVLMVFVVPRFREVFAELLNGKPMHPFTLFVLGFSESIKNHLLLVSLGGAGVLLGVQAVLRTRPGRQVWDRVKLGLWGIGPVLGKVSIARFSRTLGTLTASGVPILQALVISRETAGNLTIGRAIQDVHDSVKEGGAIAPPLKASGVFPATLVGLIDVGEQTGALPEMLLRIADDYEEEVDNAVASITSIIEPVMIVFLAMIVGTIVLAIFLPMVELLKGMQA